MPPYLRSILTANYYNQNVRLYRANLRRAGICASDIGNQVFVTHAFKVRYGVKTAQAQFVTLGLHAR
jgi:hypothetical protein